MWAAFRAGFVKRGVGDSTGVRLVFRVRGHVVRVVMMVVVVVVEPEPDSGGSGGSGDGEGEGDEDGFGAPAARGAGGAHDWGLLGRCKWVGWGEESG